jgi:hypothetical protein
VLTEIAITKAAYDLASLRTVRLEISSIKNQDKHFTSPTAKLTLFEAFSTLLGLKKRIADRHAYGSNWKILYARDPRP